MRSEIYRDHLQKKVLMITHHFPPVSEGGTQRKLRFARYLPQFGWTPVVLATKVWGYENYDWTLLEKIPKNVSVYHTVSFDLMRLLMLWKNGFSKKKRGRMSEAGGFHVRKGFLALLSRLLNRWVLIPESAIGWLPFAVLSGVQIVRREKIDILLSTSAPYTCHLVGLLLKKITGIPLVVDFRDAWTNNPLSPLMPRWRRHLEAYLEKKVVITADAVITVSNPILNDLRKKYPLARTTRVLTITNGYDPENFHPRVANRPNQFTITCTGTFYAKQTPQYFFCALHKIFYERQDLKDKIMVEIMGAITQEVMEMIVHLGLSRNVVFHGYCSHEKVIEAQIMADILLLILPKGAGSKGWFPGKIFEYLAARRYILALVPEGTAADLVRKTNAGVVVAPEDIDQIKDAILNLYNKYRAGELELNPNIQEIEKYDGRKLTESLAKVLNQTTSQNQALQKLCYPGGKL